VRREQLRGEDEDGEEEKKEEEAKGCTCNAFAMRLCDRATFVPCLNFIRGAICNEIIYTGNTSVLRLCCVCHTTEMSSRNICGVGTFANVCPTFVLRSLCHRVMLDTIALRSRCICGTFTMRSRCICGVYDAIALHRVCVASAMRLRYVCNAFVVRLQCDRAMA
jgi:hypothetical protein